MLRVQGHQSNEFLILDGEWFEKHRSGSARARLPAATFHSAEVEQIERRKKLFGGDKEQLVQATLRFDGGPFVGFTVPIERRGELQQLLDGLEAARASAAGG